VYLISGFFMFGNSAFAHDLAGRAQGLVSGFLPVIIPRLMAIGGG